MNERSIEIRFKPKAGDISPDELALLESTLPEIIHAMIRAEKENETD